MVHRRRTEYYRFEDIKSNPFPFRPTGRLSGTSAPTHHCRRVGKLWIDRVTAPTRPSGHVSTQLRRAQHQSVPSVRPSVRSVRPSVSSSIRPSVRLVPSIRTFAHQSVRPSVRPSIRPVRTSGPSVCTSIHTFVRQSVRPSVRPFIRTSIRTSVSQSVHPSVRQSVRPSVRLAGSYVWFVRSPVRLFDHTSIRPFVSPSGRTSVCLTVRSSVRTSVRLSIRPTGYRQNRHVDHRRRRPRRRRIPRGVRRRQEGALDRSDRRPVDRPTTERRGRTNGDFGALRRVDQSSDGRRARSADGGWSAGAYPSRPGPPRRPLVD